MAGGRECEGERGRRRMSRRTSWRRRRRKERKGEERTGEEGRGEGEGDRGAGEGRELVRKGKFQPTEATHLDYFHPYWIVFWVDFKLNEGILASANGRLKKRLLSLWMNYLFLAL